MKQFLIFRIFFFLILTITLGKVHFASSAYAFDRSDVSDPFNRFDQYGMVRRSGEKKGKASQLAPRSLFGKKEESEPLAPKKDKKEK